MLDPDFVRTHPDAVKRAAEQKRVGTPQLVDDWLAADGERRAAQRLGDELKAQQRAAGERMKDKGLSKDDRAALQAELATMKASAKAAEEKQKTAEDASAALMLQLPAVPDPAWPVGRDESENVVVRTWHAHGREPRPLAEGELDHAALGAKLNILDTERGVKLAGSRSYVLRGFGAQLYTAVLRFAQDELLARGYEPFVVPVLVTEACMVGTGYFPAGRDQAYVTQDGSVLVGTSEVPLASFHANEILDAAQLPLKFSAASTCFRREAGAAGRDTAGLYRVHQFDKIEQVVVHAADEAEHVALHEEIVANAEAILQKLGLAYRVVQNCTGDMGQGKWRMYDLETWMPSRNTYGETHSGSALRDFQARRLNLRYRAPGEKGTRFCFTLNNTAVACPRVLIALLETYQRAGGVDVPEALRPYMGGATQIE